MKRTAIYILGCLLLFGCDLFKKKEENQVTEDQGKPLARVFNKYLYYEDIEGLKGRNLSKADSATIVNRYINLWIQRQLVLSRAESQVDENSSEIQKKLEECRNTLVIYEYEKAYLSQKLDSILPEQTLKSYYERNIGNFELKQNIFKGLFIKLPKNAPKLEKIKGLVASGKQGNTAELKSYCVRFSNYYILEDTVWTNFDDLVKNTPYAGIHDKADFLEKNRYAEMADAEFVYLLKIKDYKISKQISPFEFVRDQIKNILINERRIQLINELKQSIYKEGKNKNEFEIYQQK